MCKKYQACPPGFIILITPPHPNSFWNRLTFEGLGEGTSKGEGYGKKKGGQTGPALSVLVQEKSEHISCKRVQGYSHKWSKMIASL